jgi:hypothetical protein
MMTKRLLIAALSITTLAAPAFLLAKKSTKEARNATPILWQDPGDVAARDMTSGPGGPSHQPRGPFKFVKEDMEGTSPKFTLTDANGTKWKAKLDAEAHPETVASRLVWAAGYFADEEYYLPSFQVEGIGALRRGEKFVEPNGIVHNARLKREAKGEEKDGSWKWKDNPFVGTREFNGLRVMMALINNWDLKDDNNGIHEEEGKKIYLVKDLGASFGTTGRRVTREAGKGNLANYTASSFIVKVTPQFVDFGTPSRPAALLAIEPGEFKSRIDLEWIGKEIPLADARWIGSILAKLTPGQIENAFAAAGYSPQEIVGFSQVVEQRIADLNQLP